MPIALHRIDKPKAWNTVTHANMLCDAGGPVCLFTFDQLCSANVGAADYIALAKKFHTIALSDVPIFTANLRSQAYR